MTEKFYNILYKGRTIYRNLSAEDCGEILQDFSEKYYASEDMNPDDLQLEEI